MGVTIEWMGEVGLVRAGPDHHKYGDPYILSGVAHDTGTAVALKGFTGKISKAIYEEVIIRLHRLGYHTVTRERIRAGITTEKEFIMEAEIKMTVTIDGKERTVLKQQFDDKDELIRYQLAVLGGIEAHARSKLSG